MRTDCLVGSLADDAGSLADDAEAALGVSLLSLKDERGSSSTSAA